VFGSLKNYLSGKSGEQIPGPSFKASDNSSSTSRMIATPSRLTSHVENSRANLGSSAGDHPGDVTDLFVEEKLYDFITVPVK
jgi:hypothetical protein